jgi:hypothetical protein
MTGPVADSPQFSGAKAQQAGADVSADTPSVPSVQSVVPLAAPNDLAPGELDVVSGDGAASAPSGADGALVITNDGDVDHSGPQQ